MPVVHLTTPTTLSLAKARALADAVHEALVETSDVPPTDRFQVLRRQDPETLIMDPTFPNVSRTPDASIVEVLYLKGRTVDQKAAFFARVNELARSAGFKGDDIMITVMENARTDWSAGKGLSFAAVSDTA